MTTLLIGYGTLMDPESLSRTVGRSVSADELRPVVVDGFRRLFNLRSSTYEPSRVLSPAGIESSPANVEPRAGGRLNAVALTVSEAEMAALDAREFHYVRQSVTVVCFATSQAIGAGQLYVGPETGERVDRDPTRLLPRWRDLSLARAAAYARGTSFGRMYDETTFLADGTTPMLEAYQAHFNDGT